MNSILSLVCSSICLDESESGSQDSVLAIENRSIPATSSAIPAIQTVLALRRNGGLLSNVIGVSHSLATNDGRDPTVAT